MSHQPQVVYLPAPTRSNGLGVAGFVLSLVGLISCGILSPIGLVLSFVALFKRPRGLAIAGVIIGLVGSICGLLSLILGFFSMVLGAVGIGAGVAAAAPYIETEVRMAHVAEVVASHKNADGTVPSDLSALTELQAEDRTDHWGHMFRVVVTGPGKFEVISDGPDGIAGTGDDITASSSDDSDRPRHRRRRHTQVD